MKKGAKVLSVLEVVCSIGLLVICSVLWMLQRTISYENASTFEKTPKSSLFVIMENHPVLGYLFLIFGVILALAGIIRLFVLMKKEV